MGRINRSYIQGNLTRDPEAKQANSRTTICEFSLAHNSREKQGDEWVDRVDFIDVTAFGKTAELLIEHGYRGMEVLVEARLRVERWETAEGQKRRRLMLVADMIQYMSRRGGGDDSQPQERSRSTSRRRSRQPEPVPVPEGLDDDEPPF